MSKVIDHAKGEALVMRLLDLKAQAAEIRKEMAEVSMDIKDYLRAQNIARVRFAYASLTMSRKITYSFPKTRLIEKYGEEVLSLATRSESVTLDVKEIL